MAKKKLDEVVENEETIVGDNDTEKEDVKEVVENGEVKEKNNTSTTYTLKVDAPFTDKNDRTIKYKVGDILTTDDERRVKDLTKRGLAHIAE